MSKKTNPWVIVGATCGVLVLLALVAAGVGGFFMYRTARDFAEGFTDPEKREAKAKEVLGCDALPAGYHAMMSMSIPFVLKMAILSTTPPDEEGQIQGLDQGGFIYFRFLKEMDASMKQYFTGEKDDPNVLKEHHINLDMERAELIDRGLIELQDQRCYYITQRGSFQVEQGRSEGLQSLVLVECPDDNRMRMGIWFLPDPNRGVPAQEADWTGTPADPETVKAFMDHFSLCQE